MSNLSSAAASRRESARASDGTFGHQHHAESTITLPGHRPELIVEPGEKSPWGEVQHAQALAQGITTVSTDGHGGIKVASELNRQIDPAWRSSNGWYEEDCEFRIVEHHFANELGLSAEQRERTVAALKDWYPDEYTKVTGEPVSPEESRELRDRQKKTNERAWRAENAEKFIVESATHGGSDFDLPGYTQAKCRRASDGAERDYVMPIDSRFTQSPRILEDNVGTPVDITDLMAAHRAARSEITSDSLWREPLDEPVTELGLDEASLQASKRSAVAKDLDKNWRFTTPEGRPYVDTLRGYLTKYGSTGKSEAVYGDNTRRSYRVRLADPDRSGVVPVSKTTYDALTAVPDLTTDYGRHSHDRHILLNKAQKVRERFSPSWDARRREQEEVRNHEAEAQKIWDEKIAPVAGVARQARRDLAEQLSQQVAERIEQHSGPRAGQDG